MQVDEILNLVNHELGIEHDQLYNDASKVCDQPLVKLQIISSVTGFYICIYSKEGDRLCSSRSDREGINTQLAYNHGVHYIGIRNDSQPFYCSDVSQVGMVWLNTLICLCSSSKPHVANIGIRKLWVCSTHRRKGIATKLLDCIR